MKPRARASALLLLAALASSCTKYSVFEDVGSDPHPPEMQLLGVAFQPVEATTPEARSAAGRALQFLPPEGLEVRPFDDEANTLVFRVRYFDAGGDILAVRVRDLDGTLEASVTPAPPEEVDLDGDGVPDPQPTSEFFSGTSGTVDTTPVVFPPGVEGPHRLEVWAEDSHDSRSPKISFTVNVVL
jgi:hypothetical protein